MLRSAEVLKRAGRGLSDLSGQHDSRRRCRLFCRDRRCPGCTLRKKSARKPSVAAIRKLGITGTKFLVSGPVYPEKLEQMGIAYLRPTKEQQEQINTIIFDELVRGQQTPESLFYFEQVIESLKLKAAMPWCWDAPSFPCWSTRMNHRCRRWIPRGRWPVRRCGMRWQNDVIQKRSEL